MRVKITNLTAGKLFISKPHMNLEANPDNKTLDGVKMSDIENSAELKKLLDAAMITMEVSDDPAVDDRLEGGGKGGGVETEQFLDCKVTATVMHDRDDNGGAGRAAGSVLAASFGGVQTDQARTMRVVTTGMGAVAGRKVTLTGTVRGVSTTEDITIAGAAETVEGVKPFEKVTSIAFPAVPIGGDCQVQLSNKLGLARGIAATADVLKVNKNGSDIAVGTVDVTNGTVAQTIGAGDDFKITYKR